MGAFLSGILWDAADLTREQFWGESWLTLFLNVLAVAVALACFHLREHGWRGIMTFPPRWKDRLREGLLAVVFAAILPTGLFLVNVVRAAYERESQWNTQVIELRGDLRSAEFESGRFRDTIAELSTERDTAVQERDDLIRRLDQLASVVDSLEQRREIVVREEPSASVFFGDFQPETNRSFNPGSDVPIRLLVVNGGNGTAQNLQWVLRESVPSNRRDRLGEEALWQSFLASQDVADRSGWTAPTVLVGNSSTLARVIIEAEKVDAINEGMVVYVLGMIRYLSEATGETTLREFCKFLLLDVDGSPASNPCIAHNS